MKRLTRLQRELRRAADRFDAFIIHTPVNVRYFSGFMASHAILLVTPVAAHLLTDGRYAEEAKKVEGFQVTILKQGTTSTLGRVVKKLRTRRIGYEPGITVGALAGFKKVSPEATEYVGGGEILLAPRRKKSSGEAKAIRQSQLLNERILKQAIGELLDAGISNHTEAGFAARLKILMLEAGVEPSFEPIVAHGKNGSKPHYHPGDVPIGKGPTLIDMGVILNGYCSDMTRMLHWGKPTPKFLRVHDAVRRAKNASIRAAKPGAKLADVHQAGVKVLEKVGLAKYFVHGTGHGVGMEIHEPPRVSSVVEGTLEMGDVVTIEPGVYIPNWGGVRIEDIIRIKRDGNENLTSLPGSFIQL